VLGVIERFCIPFDSIFGGSFRRGRCLFQVVGRKRPRVDDQVPPMPRGIVSFNRVCFPRPRLIFGGYCITVRSTLCRLYVSQPGFFRKADSAASANQDQRKGQLLQTHSTTSPDSSTATSIPRNARGDCQELELLCHGDVGSDYYDNGNPAACTSPHALRSFAFPHYDSSPQTLPSVTNMRRCIYGSTLPWTLYAIGEPWQVKDWQLASYDHLNLSIQH
jgi:hypothetical protein